MYAVHVHAASLRWYTIHTRSKSEWRATVVITINDMYRIYYCSVPCVRCTMYAVVVIAALTRPQKTLQSIILNSSINNILLMWTDQNCGGFEMAHEKLFLTTIFNHCCCYRNSCESHQYAVWFSHFMLLILLYQSPPDFQYCCRR